MRYLSILKRTALLTSLWMGGISTSQAALFNFTYDDLADQDISSGNIVGSGIFSYDGDVSVGFFALSALSNISFSATVQGESFSTADIQSPLDLTGISVFDIGGGHFGLVFTGGAGSAAGGSLDLENGNSTILTHEPTPGGIGSSIGCCGGDGFTNLYQLSPDFFGDYAATTASASVPNPAVVSLIGLGLIGLGWSRRKKA